MNTHSPPIYLADLACALPPFKGQGSTVGVFDSGLGGLSVMQSVKLQLPQANLLYVADSGHAPYGEREDNFIVERSSRIVDFLHQQGAQIIVVACNTATAAAIATLRQQWPDLPIIGIEPGVKPAVNRSLNKRVGVLATPATLSSLKFQSLIDKHAAGAHLVLQACPGLAKEIEQGELDTPTLRDLVAGFCEPLIAANVDTVVLGCTHYPLISPLFQAALPSQVHLLDTADAVAMQTAKLAQQVNALADKRNNTWPETSGQVSLFTSGAPHNLSQMAQSWLGLNLPAQALPAAA